MKKSTLCIILLQFLFVFPAFAEKVAVIGGGGAGMVSTFLVEGEHEVTLYEAGSELGGHLKTEVLDMAGKKIAVDAGAEFINSATYNNLIRLLKYLLIATTTFTMSFNFFHTKKNDSIVLPLYANGKFQFRSLWPSNLLRLIQLKWFMYKGQKILDNKQYDRTLEDFVGSLWLTQSFKNHFLYPFLAAQWGVSPEKIKQLSAFQALKYITDGEQSNNIWLEVPEGLSSYITALKEQLENTNILLNTPVDKVTKTSKGYKVTTEDGKADYYDQVIFAVNPKIIGHLTRDMKGIQKFSQQCQKVETFKTALALCKNSEANQRYLPKCNAQVVNVRYNGKNSALTINKPWKSGHDLQNVLKIWLNFDIRRNEQQSKVIPDDLYGIYEFQHVFMDKHYYKSYTAARKEEAKGKGLWFPGIHENDSHEGTLTEAINTAKQIAPSSKRLEIFGLKPKPQAKPCASA